MYSIVQYFPFDWRVARGSNSKGIISPRRFSRPVPSPAIGWATHNSLFLRFWIRHWFLRFTSHIFLLSYIYLSIHYTLKYMVRAPGFEPGSHGWQPRIITRLYYARTIRGITFDIWIWLRSSPYHLPMSIALLLGVILHIALNSC